MSPGASIHFSDGGGGGGGRVSKISTALRAKSRNIRTIENFVCLVVFLMLNLMVL